MSKAEKESIQSTQTQSICGIAMPISLIAGYEPSHWTDVLNIIRDAASTVHFESRLVSELESSGIIQKQIIQNLYNDDIVICDISGKNPNVMFELGMRLAFDKPTIVIKDDITDYSFDTSPIKHLIYPRDLRFNKIIQFKIELAEMIKATYAESKSDSGYSSFLKNFGQFTVAKLKTTEISSENFILEELKSLKLEIKKYHAMIQERENLRFQPNSIQFSPNLNNIDNTLKNPMYPGSVNIQDILLAKSAEQESLIVNTTAAMQSHKKTI